MRWMLPCIAVAGALPSLAFAHPGLGSPESFATGVAHPFTGVDHVTAILAVGLWAALKGHRAVWAWSASFVGMMFIGGAMGMAHVAVPYVDAGILASVIVMGLLVAFAVDLPVAAGMALIGAFAFLHGHAHGSEVPETANGVMFLAGPGDIVLNEGRSAISLTVANTGGRPIQVGSHFHFAEVNAALAFDREA